MSRVRRGFKANRRRKKVLKLAKGYHFDRRTKYRHAAATVNRALHYSYVSRKLLKRDMRKLWIIRIGAACKMLDTSYSKFMGSLKKKGITINRKMLSEMAIHDMEGFKVIINLAK